MLALVGYFFAVIMGMTLGTIGAGGSILTVPILVYFLGISPILATSYSLLIVGSTALVGGLQYLKRKEVDLNVVMLFSFPSLIAVYVTRRWLMPIIPDTLLTADKFIVTKDQGIMLLFVSLMVLASIFMIYRSQPLQQKSTLKKPFLGLIVTFEGIVVGVLTGIIGAGGGFLIIPALVLLAGLDMKMAIGSSLLIIAIKSMIGFVGDLQAGIYINYQLFLVFLMLTLVGLFLGTAISKKLPKETLKKGFGWFTLIMGMGILVNEFFKGAL